MERIKPQSSEIQGRGEAEDFAKRAATYPPPKNEHAPEQQVDQNVFEDTKDNPVTIRKDTPGKSDEQKLDELPTGSLPVQKIPATPPAEHTWAAGNGGGQRTDEIIRESASIETHKMSTVGRSAARDEAQFLDMPTTPLPALMSAKPLANARSRLTRGRAIFLALLLAIVLINASVAGFSHFFGPHGWGSAFNNSSNANANLLNQLRQQLQHNGATPGSSGHTTPQPSTPDQIINTILANMTLDQKLGQMMIVQFTGQDYSPQLDAMINQYQVGGVLFFQFNIGNKSQLTGLTSQMQHNASLPLIVSVDQEGGTVDRFVNLDGAQPPASVIGASGSTNQAYQQGVKDAQDLASYGFNLNLAPVVDVTNVYNSQLYERTYGNNPAIVTKMSGAYLQGLQKSGKVLGTLKHFPGLGAVSVDPHFRPPDLTRSLANLNAIDWAPYSALIKQGDVYSIMVTHEYVKALDSSEPSSLSPQVIGILRNQMHYQGVIITDSLTMDSIHNYYTYGQAAAKAVEAGDDILMGAASANDVAAMIDGIKQAISSGAISQQQIDASVRRILLFKYRMGLLHL
jgi:beta-N-acetylhexosaminidase